MIHRMTVRQRQVLRGVLAGKTNDQIGIELGINEVSVKYHTTNIYKKECVKSRAELMAKYIKLERDKLPGVKYE